MGHIKEEWKRNFTVQTDYRRLVKHKLALLVTLLVVFVVAVVIAMKIGSYDLSTASIINSLLGAGDKTTDIVIWKLRMPRIIAAIMSGAALSISGLIIQTLLNNPLASPSTLGVSQGAAFGASFAIIVLGAINLGVGSSELISGGHFNIVTICAFVGSLSVVLVVWLLQRFKNMSSGMVILAGVALSSLFVSGTIMIQYFADEVEIAAAVFWTFGDVTRSTWHELLILSIVTTSAFGYFMFKTKALNALCAGDETALNLGIEVNRFRLIGLIVASLLAALVTSFHGVIAFLGLLAPHIGRKLFGSNHLYLLPGSVLIGAELLLLSDILGRIVIVGGTFPVGVITSFLGAPLFLYLIIVGPDYVRR